MPRGGVGKGEFASIWYGLASDSLRTWEVVFPALDRYLRFGKIKSRQRSAGQSLPP